MITNEPCRECGKMMDIEFMYGICSQECIDSWIKHQNNTLEALKKYHPSTYKMLNVINKMFEEHKCDQP